MSDSAAEIGPQDAAFTEAAARFRFSSYGLSPEGNLPRHGVCSFCLMPSRTTHVAALHRAATAIGGEDALATALHATLPQTQRWLAGKDYPPTEVYHRALDVLIGIGAA
jgi:hypothetical protein